MSTGLRHSRRLLFLIFNLNQKMKNLFLTYCLLSLCICSFAQTERGSFKIDGYTGFSRTEEEREFTSQYTGSSEMTFTSLSFTPAVSYFVIKGLAVGGSISLTRNTTKYGEPTPYDEKFVSRSTTVGPSVQYYIPLTKSLYFVPGASIRWGRTVTTGFYWIGGDVVEEYENKGSSRTIDVNAGLNYGHSKTDYEPDQAPSESVTRGTFSVGIGVSIFLTRNSDDE
jgi:hypothetical protein